MKPLMFLNLRMIFFRRFRYFLASLMALQIVQRKPLLHLLWRRIRAPYRLSWNSCLQVHGSTLVSPFMLTFLGN